MAQHPFRIYAHRGACAELPENTLEAFQRAVDLGVDALELDVHVTSDDHVVVIHDANAARTTGVDRRVARARLAEVQSWDAGFGHQLKSGERPFVGKGMVVPTLADVIAAFGDMAINVDVKHHEPWAVARVIRQVVDLGATQRVTLTSVSHRMVLLMAELGYPGPLGMGQAEAIRVLCLPAGVLRRLTMVSSAIQIPHHYHGVDFGLRWLIRRCHALGLRVDYWTVNDPALAHHLAALGADGIMTDDPARIINGGPYA